MRLLGIDPNSKGIGFVVLENDNKLVDWGTKYLSTKQKECKIGNRRYLPLAEKLIEYFSPDGIVYEDGADLHCRRSSRTKRLLRQFGSLADKYGVTLYKIPRNRLMQFFAKDGMHVKHEIASFLGNYFRDVQHLVPPKRKAWMSDSVHMNMFMALAMAYMVFDQN